MRLRTRTPLPTPYSPLPSSWLIILCIATLFAFSTFPVAAQEIDHLAEFADPARIWGNGVERVIEEAYRACFKTRIIGDRIMNIRIPFAQNNERELLSKIKWRFLGDGKMTPDTLWPIIEKTIDSERFARYARTISDGREQVVIFDIPTQSWRSSRDLFEIARIKSGSYWGILHRPQVLVSGKGIDEPDVYNYLYCIGHIGMDCSGFVWYVLSYIAQQGGVDLGQPLTRSLGIPTGRNPSWYAGTSFYDSKSSLLVSVRDEIANLRPADIILFRGPDGDIAHSAIIQSIDFSQGIIRYLQCTDNAPINERGVHESFAYFNPARPRVSLKDSSIKWTQMRYATFRGEVYSTFPNDGERYRAYSALGGGRVVRLKTLAPIIEKLK